MSVTPGISPNCFLSFNVNLPAGTYYVHKNNFSNFNLRNSDNTSIVGNTFASQSVTITDTAVYLILNNPASIGEFVLNFSDLYINEGTEDLGYEEFGAMPSPEFPSEIESVSGKNLFALTDFKSVISSLNYEITNETLTLTATGNKGAQYLIKFIT